MCYPAIYAYLKKMVSPKADRLNEGGLSSKNNHRHLHNKLCGKYLQRFFTFKCILYKNLALIQYMKVI